MHELVKTINLLRNELEVMDNLDAFLGKVEVIGKGRAMGDGWDGGRRVWDGGN